MPCLPNANLSNDGIVPGIVSWVRKMPTCMIFTTHYVFVQKNVKISSGQNVLNCLFFGAPSFSNKPKLGLKTQLKVQTLIYPSL